MLPVGRFRRLSGVPRRFPAERRAGTLLDRSSENPSVKRSQKGNRALWVCGAGLVGVIALAAALWHFTPLGELLRPQEMAKRLEAADSGLGAPLMFYLAYVVGGLVVFPVTVLSATTAIVFSPLKAVSISFTGILTSAALLYFIGARFLRSSANNALRNVSRRVDEALSDRGIITIATLRMIPLAPFTLVNLAAGVVGVRFRDYMLGTALGLAPGMTAVVLFGRQVRNFWREPTWAGAAIAIAVGGAWIGLSLLLQRAVVQRNRRRSGKPVAAAS